MGTFGANTGDPLGNALMARGLANRRASDYAAATRTRPLGAPAILNTVLPDRRWEGLKQALFDAGVGKLQTGARVGMGAPGFFDTQRSIEDDRVAQLLEALSMARGGIR